MPENDRLIKLRQMLEKTPDDPFLVYALGMEQKKTDKSAAIATFDRVVLIDPNYCYAYFQKGQTLELLGDLHAAKEAYQTGIAAATRAGDAHARSELEGALSMLD